MEYRITKLYVGHRNQLLITAEEYEQLKTALRGISAALSIEQAFDFVLENYAEFEQELLRLTQNLLMFYDRDWASMQSELYLINRRLINLLTTCRLYIDQLPHIINSTPAFPAGLVTQIRRKTSEEYESHFSYRLFAALRNYTQHRGLPIFQIRYGRSRQESGDAFQLKHTVTFSISVDKLKENGGLKADVMKELETMGELVNIKPFVRDYIDSMGRIHCSARKALEADISKWEAIISNMQARYQEAYKEDLNGLGIKALDETGKAIESLTIIDDLIKYRQRIERKNSMLVPFGPAFVSGDNDH